MYRYFDERVRRGDILLANLAAQCYGSIQGGRRPVVVISNNRANKHSPVLTVVPLSTKIDKKANLPTHVFVSVYQSLGLEQHSMALCEQLMPIGREKIVAKMGRVDWETLARITEGVQIHVGAFRQYN